MSLADRIVEALQRADGLTDWEIANRLYSGCMNRPDPANGARVANIRKVCYKDARIIQTEKANYLK